MKQPRDLCGILTVNGETLGDQLEIISPSVYRVFVSGFGHCIESLKFGLSIKGKWKLDFSPRVVRIFTSVTKIIRYGIVALEQPYRRFIPVDLSPCYQLTVNVGTRVQRLTGNLAE